MTVRTLFDYGQRKYGSFIERHRGELPPGIPLVEFALETGFKPECVATDKRLTECGIAGVELERYFDQDADPFDAETSIWLGCRDLLDDLAAYRKQMPEATQADHLYLMFLNFASGGGAVRHILAVVCALQSEGYTGLSLRDRIVKWSESPDFWRPVHAKFYGAQSPSLVQKRIRKQIDRLGWADEYGGLEIGTYAVGGACAPRRPPSLRGFPEDLKEIARRKKNPGLTRAEHERLHEEVEEYARAHRRRRLMGGEVKAGLRVRVARWLSMNPHGRSQPT
jgi:hypothetical protein